jgi:DUF4097 and DUF4098 domain-containing protein YvlB
LINYKKIATFACAVVGVLIVGAIVIGILNALVADGKWTFGWRDYRYDEEGYTVGEGSIPVTDVKRIEVDWIDGSVTVHACQDRYPSVTEVVESELPESAQVRWRVDEDGTLRIKYRKSSWFFAVGSGNREKGLILRIPEKMMENLSELDVEGVSTNVTMNNIHAESLTFSSASGWLLTAQCSFETASVTSESGEVELDADISGAVTVSTKYGKVTLESALTPSAVSIATKSGDVRLVLPADASFAFAWNGKGSVTSDLACTQQDNLYRIGDGAHTYSITSKDGDLTLTEKK